MSKLCIMLKSKKMSQSNIARKLRVSRAAVCQAYREGIRTVSTAQKYAAVIDCDWIDLLEIPAVTPTPATNQKEA